MSARISLMPRISIYIIALILFAASSLAAQNTSSPITRDVKEFSSIPQDTSTPKPLIATFKSELGFSYSYPSGWEVVDMKPAMPVIRQKIEEKSDSDQEKKGAECAQIDLMLRNQSPLSLIEVLTMQNACFPVKPSVDSLAAFGLGMAKGLQKTLDITNPVYSSYKLGTHSIWIEKASATIKDSSATHYILEVSCTLLHKGFVCIVAFAHDDQALEVFESGRIVLDDEAPVALVPADAFKNANK